MRLVLLLATSAFVGCATTEKFENQLASWVGAPELDLIRQWGPPVSSYESGDSRFLTYSSSRNMFVPGAAPTYTTTVVGNTAFTNAYGGSPAMNIGLSCQTTFEIRGGRVSQWRYQGNDCKAK